MAEDKSRYIDIRSNGGGVVGRVFDENGEIIHEPFKGPTRKAMLKKFRSKFNPNPSINIKRRGKTYF